MFCVMHDNSFLYAKNSEEKKGWVYNDFVVSKIFKGKWSTCFSCLRVCHPGPDLIHHRPGLCPSASF